MTDELSELFAVDVCFGNHILEAFKGLSGGPKEFVEFLSRDDDEKVFRHDADSVQAFLKAYMGDAKAAKTETAGHRVNVPKIPVC